MNNNFRLLVISTSTIHGSSFLTYIKNDLVDFIQTDELIFVPYARPSGISYDEYTAHVQEALKDKGIRVKGLHTFSDQKDAIKKAKA